MKTSPYIRDSMSVPYIMYSVLVALIPAILTTVFFFGYGLIWQIALASITAIFSETILLRLRGVSPMRFVFDGSGLITAFLLSLSIPSLAPWWVIVVGTAFAIVFSKQLYGGLGYNLFNPAMIGYAVLLISFPALMTRWNAPLSFVYQPLGLMESFDFIFQGNVLLDGMTMATPLDYLKTQLSLKQTVSQITQSPIFGFLGGYGTEWIGLAYLIGGLWLWQRRIITWHLPFAFLCSLFLIAGCFYLLDETHYASPIFHLFSGATMLGAFFIITDPVSGPTTPKGKIIFSAGIALLTYLIRVVGGYPDGIAFAVLLFNMLAPLIDIYTQPKVFGRTHE